MGAAPNTLDELLALHAQAMEQAPNDPEAGHAARHLAHAIALRMAAMGAQA